MTEAEAMDKLCPQMIGHPQSHANQTAKCVGSLCMAWRWSEAKRTAAFLEAVQAHMQKQPKPNFNTALQAVYAEKGGAFEHTEGVCGLAGEPK